MRSASPKLIPHFMLSIQKKSAIFFYLRTKCGTTSSDPLCSIENKVFMQTKKQILTQIYIPAIITVIIHFFNIMFTADKLDKILGYIFSLFIVPFLIYAIFLMLFNKLSMRRITLLKNWSIHIFVGLLMSNFGNILLYIAFTYGH